MSDRTCPDCGTPLAGSWSMRGGHQQGSAACRVARTTRDMNVIDYCYVQGAIAVALASHGVQIKYGSVRAPEVSVFAASKSSDARRAVVGAFAPKACAFVYSASTEGLRVRAALDRVLNDPDFAAAVVTTYELAEDRDAAVKAVRTLLAAERLL